MLLRPEERALFAETTRKYQKFTDSASAVVNSLREFFVSGKSRYEQYQTMYEDSIKMVQLTSENSKKFTTDAAASLVASTRVVSAILGIVLVLGIAVAVFITRGIVRPLSSTQQFAEDVAAGNLDRELNVRTNDETGKLADALRSMVGSLKQNIDDAHRTGQVPQPHRPGDQVAQADPRHTDKVDTGVPGIAQLVEEAGRFHGGGHRQPPEAGEIAL